MFSQQTSTSRLNNNEEQSIQNVTLITNSGGHVKVTLHIHKFTYANRMYKGVFLELHKEDSFKTFNRMIRSNLYPILVELNLIDVKLDVLVGNDPYALLRLYEKCKDYVYTNFNIENYPIKNDATYNAFYTNLTELLYCSALSLSSGRGASEFGNVQHLYNIISHKASKMAYPIVLDREVSNKQPIYRKMYKKFVHGVKGAFFIKISKKNA